MSLIHRRDRALPPGLFRRLRTRVLALGEERFRTTYRTTFWFDFGPATSLVEEAIREVRPLLPAQSLLGVEWWLSRMWNTRVRVDFHQDRDEQLMLSRRQLKHPRFSSVLFLNRVQGGALAVTTQLPNRRNPYCIPLPLDADLVGPRPNRFVWFDGNLTHGVLDSENRLPSNNSRMKRELRLTVVMNWWTRRPVGVRAFVDAGIYPSLRLVERPGSRKDDLRARPH